MQQRGERNQKGDTENNNEKGKNTAGTRIHLSSTYRRPVRRALAADTLSVPIASHDRARYARPRAGL